MVCQYILKLCFFSISISGICCKSALLAQVIPDRTLGNESSVVNFDAIIQDKSVDLIEGGATRGNNLFHSFAEFNVSESQSIYFASPDNIANILTRVTGNNISYIFGTLGVDGSANLFLLNPNGIVFGNNSALDLNGSFLATTAQGYIFDRNFEYSASDPKFPPLLTVNLPIGLQMGNNPQPLVNRSRFSDNEDFVRGLAIAPEQTLSLVGGEVLLEGGYLSTSSGNLEIASVGANNRINLQNNSRGWNLDYEGVTSFEDLKINNQGGIYGGMTGGSKISLTGKNISLGYDLETINYDVEDFSSLEALPRLNDVPSDSVEIIGNNLDSELPPQIAIDAQDTFSMIKEGEINLDTTGKGNAGRLEVTANSIVMYGSGFSSSSTKGSSGNAGNVTFNANRMSVQNGGGGVNTSGAGNGGAIDLNIANELNIQFGGFGADTFDTGDGGRINIDAGDLEIIYGGAGVNTVGSGNGGVLDLKIANELNIQFGGFGANTFDTGDGGRIEIETKVLNLANFSGIGVDAGNFGKGGEIAIAAETIILNNGAITSKSGTREDPNNLDIQELQNRFGQTDGGDGGNIAIAADSLFLNNGANISTTTIGIGNAGDIDLKVDRLEVQGDRRTAINSSTDASGDGGNIYIVSNDIILTGEASIAASVNLSQDSPVDLGNNSIGNAGDIDLVAQNTIQLQDNGFISVDGGDEGGTGNINLTAETIDLTDDSSISARVESGNEGNINLDAKNLFLDDRAKITTNATNDSSGGNIEINLQDNLVTKANSQIVSNAVAGRGGNIAIKTRGLFRSFNSTIEASSQFGIDGSVRVNTLDTNSTSDLILLPDNPIDSSQYLTAGCGLKNDYSFVNIGRGGLPANSYNTIVQKELLPDLEVEATDIKTTELDLSDRTLKIDDSIVEAATWKINQQGKIELVTRQISDRFYGHNFSCSKR